MRTHSVTRQDIPTNASNHSSRLTWLLAALLMTMRAAWIWPWLLALGTALAPAYPRPLLPLWSLFALLLGGRVAAQVAAARAGTLRRARVWIAVLGPVLLLLLLWWEYGRPLALWDLRWLQLATGDPALWSSGFAPAVVAFFVGAGLWLRGVLDGGAPLDHETISRAFVTGSVAFALLLLITRLANAPLVAGVQTWLVVFIATSMAALALASLDRSLYAGSAGTAIRLRFSRYWLGSVAIVIVAVLLAGWLLSALIAPETVAQAFALLTPLLDVVARVLFAVLTAVVYLVFLVLTPLLEWLRALFAGLAPPPPIAEQALFQPLSPLVSDQPSGPPIAWLEPLRWGVMIAAVVVTAVIFALALRLFRAGEPLDVEETRESILSRSLLSEQMRALWARLRRGAGTGPDADFLSLADETPERRQIRAGYQTFLAAMRTRSGPRPPDATPAAYATQLTELTPEQKTALNMITATYVEVRYGAAAPSAAEIARSGAALPGVVTPQNE